MSYSDNSNNKLSSYPLPEDKEMVAKLWQDVFHDTDEFVNLFFSRVYKPENTLVIKHNDMIIAALQMIPYDLKLNNKIIPSAYVCGVCTHPSERGKGLMNKLMHEAMNEMQKKGFGITTLIPAEPWLFDFYKKFGYTQPVNYSIEEYTCHQQSVEAMNTDCPYTFVECTNEHFPYFDSKQRERKCTVLHNVYDFETIIRDLKNDGGYAGVLLKENNPVGMIFAQKNPEDKVIIKEFLSDNIVIKSHLISYLLKRYNTHETDIYMPVHPPGHILHGINIHTYGLACVLDKNMTDNISDLYMSLMLN